MHQVTVNMPIISKCTASECAYNKNQNCHAKAITVGDFSNPGCDTFFNNGQHSSRLEVAGVGACKVSSCRHNRDFECSADNIEVGRIDGLMKCLTCKLVA